MKAWFLRLHRWLGLAFALPLLVVLATGFVLSFEPWVVGRAIAPGSLTAAKVQGLLAEHDPKGEARGIAYRAYDNTLTIGSGRGGSGIAVDVATGKVATQTSRLAETLRTARRMHESLLLDAGWLVLASTIAMLVMSLLGILMGWPSLANTLSGWHKGMAWGLLPLVVLSPLTGLLLFYKVSLTPAPRLGPPGAREAQVRLAEAVAVVAKSHDLSGLVWLRPQGPRTLARLVENGEYKVYAVTAQGTEPQPRNWPRLWHEGNFAGIWSALMNVVASVAMLGLLVTGLSIWLRRKLRFRRIRREKALQAGQGARAGIQTATR